MTALPISSDFTAAGATEGAFKTAVSNQRAYLAGILGADGNVATALTTLGALGSGYLSKTAAYTATTSDRGRLIDASNSWTLRLPEVASVGAGFSFALCNSGTGVITINPHGSETINDSPTIDFGPGQGSVIISTGTAWVALIAEGGAIGVITPAAGTFTQMALNGDLVFEWQCDPRRTDAHRR